MFVMLMICGIGFFGSLIAMWLVQKRHKDIFIFTSALFGFFFFIMGIVSIDAVQVHKRADNKRINGIVETVDDYVVYLNDGESISIGKDENVKWRAQGEVTSIKSDGILKWKYVLPEDKVVFIWTPHEKEYE